MLRSPGAESQKNRLSDPLTALSHQLDWAEGQQHSGHFGLSQNRQAHTTHGHSWNNVAKVSLDQMS
jgi:hypothetical protein